MKTIQCVFERFPDKCPKIGFWSVSFNISLTDLSVSFHLNIRKPPLIRTRKHSLKPSLNISFQSALGREPYFISCQPAGRALPSLP